MGLRNVAVGLVIVVSALGLLVWMSRSAELKQQEEERLNPRIPVSEDAQRAFEKYRLEGAPPIAEQGPHPKAVVDRILYNFGRISVGEQQKQKFVIQNEGQAPLKLTPGRRACECAYVIVPEKEVSPGSSAEIEAVWTSREHEKKYEQIVRVLTNDPENREIGIKLIGEVVFHVSIKPGLTWRFGELTDETPAIISGFLGSAEAASFKILGVESHSPHLKVDFSPSSAEEIAANKCKSGFSLKAQLSQTFPVGKFVGSFSVRTDLEKGPGTDGMQVLIDVEGLRAGPIRTLAASNNSQWNPNTRQLFMGRFEASRGKVTSLPLLIQEPGGRKFEIVSVDSNGKHLNTRLEPAIGDDAKLGDRNRYDLIFEVPPGSPPEVHDRSQPVTVRAKTNNADVPEMTFSVLYISF